jgi:RNA polymerase sigma-70 factor (ECF subfamily)
MRGILIDFARSRRYQKRGGEAIHIPLDNALGIASQPAVDLVMLDDALNALSRLDPRKSQVVELRFFGGLTVEETAEALRISPETVMRDWTMAKAWLAHELGGEKPDGT